MVASLCNPETVIEFASGDEVTVYPVIASPFAAGAIHETIACRLCATALTLAGALGTSAGTTAFDGDERALVPNAFEAVTVKV